MQIKTKVRYHFISVRMAIIKKARNNKCWWGCGERGPSYTAGGKCKLVQPLWKTVWRFLEKIRNETTTWSSPVLGIYPKSTKTLIQKGTCTPMFIAALFTTAKTWKQPRCPSTDEWIKKLWYIYTMEYYLAIKKMKICHLQQHGWTLRVSR